MAKTSPGIVTFKADSTLIDAMRGVPNRSEFIREAILAALDSSCPLCGGTGTLTPSQRRHWQDFTAEHGLEECRDCHALHLVCGADAGMLANPACGPGECQVRDGQGNE